MTLQLMGALSVFVLSDRVTTPVSSHIWDRPGHAQSFGLAAVAAY